MLLSEILQNPIYQRKTNQELANTQGFKRIPQTEWKGKTMKEILGQPTQSAATRMSGMIPEENNPALGYSKGGAMLSALTSGLNSGLGFYGAISDARAQKAYAQQMAELAAQEREDKLKQQQWENDYKNRELAQKEALQQGQFANQKDIEAMKIAAAQEQAKLANANAIAAERRKVEQEQALHDRALLEQGIDPELYKNNAEYRAQINAGIKQQALQDQLNAANIELGKSGKVGMDKVQQVIADPSRKLQYGDNSLLSNFLGINKFGISKPQEGYQAPLSLSEITQSYKNSQNSDGQSIDTNRVGKFSLSALWGK